MPILVLFGMVWFGLVMFWFGFILILIIWCVSIVPICYHAKSGACSLKKDRVISILVLLSLFWYGIVLLVIVVIIIIVVVDILDVLAKTPGFYQVLELSYPCCHCHPCCCHCHPCCCCCCCDHHCCHCH